MIWRLQINCDLEDDDKKAWDEFISSLNLIKTSNRFWLINSISTVHDSKNSFGTSNDVERMLITKFATLKSGKLAPFRIKSNCTMYQISYKDFKMLFLPELLIISNKRELNMIYVKRTLLAAKKMIEEGDSISDIPELEALSLCKEGK